MSQMSSNKRQKTEDNFRRHSFSDRVCDDLCELILQFLPQKDKFRLECVSKQFQRTVFVRHTELRDVHYFGSEEQLKRFERLLQKLPNIKVLATSPDGCHKDIAFDLIAKYCPKISDLVSNDGNNLMEIFGPKLVSLYLLNSNDINWQTMTNIEELFLSKFTSQLSSVKFKRLKKFGLRGQVSDEEIDLLEPFFELNAYTIKHLSFSSHVFHKNDVKKVKRILKIATKLPNLVHFRLRSRFPLNDKPFAEELRQLALKCVRLKSLHINYTLDLTNGVLNGVLLSPLKQFKALKRMKDISIDSQQKDFFSFNLFDGFQELTHLKISCNRSLSESVLTGIDVNLPKLQSLKFNSICITASEWTADILSRLSRLQTIEIKVQNKSIIPQIVTQLSKNCRKINKIDISSNFTPFLEFLESLIDDNFD